ncbi:MAG: PTS sugar transporter subunit IIC [Erysipelotrichaceae bacterium]
MKHFIKFLEEKFSPKMNKIGENKWIKTISGSIMLVLPTILLGSVISVYNVLRGYIPSLPDMQPLFNFSFGLYSIILAFLIGYHGMKVMNHAKYKLAAGIISLSSFMMMVNPTIADGSLTVEFSRFGPKGILISFVAGLFSVFIVHMYSKWDPFKNNVTVPEFMLNWFNQIIPAFVVLFTSMIFIYYLKIDIFNLVTELFAPINDFGQTLPGFILICLTPAFFYSLGISSWLLSPVYTPIMLAGIAANIENVAQGLAATNIVTQETIFVGFIWLGGMGATLPLVLLMMRSRSRKLKTLGGVCIVPSLFNINEPVIFGAPVAFNPLLMPPMWINAVVGPIITWIFMTSGIVKVPAILLTGVKLPMPISSVLVSDDFKAILLWAVLLVVYTLVWYPFFKAYEKQEMANEVTSV